MGGVNYKAWEIKEKDFPKRGSFAEQAKFLLGYAILAPSSHNTQPWKFVIRGKTNTIHILPDLERALIYSDRTQRELYLSLGCVLANLLIAAQHFGFQTHVDFLPEEELENVAVKIGFKKQKKENILASLFPYITRRTSNRNRYIRKTIKKEIFAQLLSYNDENGVAVSFVTENKKVKEVANILKEAVLFAFNDKIFKEELSHWVRSNYTTKFDGIPLFGFGIPGLLSLLAPFMIKLIPATLQASMDEEFVILSSSLLVIVIDEDSKESWLKAGKVYEYLTLACLKENIGMAPMAAIIEHGESNKKLQKLLGTQMKPVFFARMGYAKKVPPHSPRRSVEDVTTQSF